MVLSVAPREVRIEVADDGVGFDPASVREGVGLSGVRERVAALGGSLELESAPGRGTSVRVCIPYAASR